MNTAETKEFIADYCRQNIKLIRKKFKNTTDDMFEKFFQAKGWKRESKTKDKDGNTERVFIRGSGTHERGLFLRVTVTEVDGEPAAVTVRKWWDTICLKD